MDWHKRSLIAALRLPPEPRPPAGSEESVRIFRAAPNYYRYALARWGLRQVGVVLGLIFVFGVWLPLQSWMKLEVKAEVVEEIRSKVVGAAWIDRLQLVEVRPVSEESDEVVVSFGPALFWIEIFGVAFVLLQIPVTLTMVQLDYELRWYIVTDRSLRIREGVRKLRESTTTFANIQNLTIEQGPIQRLLGIADLKVRTAGGGARGQEDASGESETSESMHVSYLRGIDDAPALRDEILDHLQKLKSAGLGDVEPVRAETMPTSVVDAARDVLREVRALRGAL